MWITKGCVGVGGVWVRRVVIKVLSPVVNAASLLHCQLNCWRLFGSALFFIKVFMWPSHVRTLNKWSLVLADNVLITLFLCLTFCNYSWIDADRLKLKMIQLFFKQEYWTFAASCVRIYCLSLFFRTTNECFSLLVGQRRNLNHKIFFFIWFIYLFDILLTKHLIYFLLK